MRSGWVSSATSFTQFRIPWWVVGAVWFIWLLSVDAVSAVMAYRSLSRVRYAESRNRPSSVSMVCRGVLSVFVAASLQRLLESQRTPNDRPAQ
jgi:hypothetical protein